MSMQVILMEKVANLGNLGDVVKVKDGFARNYLIPHGKAKRATPENIKHFEGRRAELEKAQNETLAKAQERAAKLENLKLQISQKAASTDVSSARSPTTTSSRRSRSRGTTSSARRCACRRGRSSRWASSRSRSCCTPT